MSVRISTISFYTDEALSSKAIWLWFYGSTRYLAKRRLFFSEKPFSSKRSFKALIETEASD